MKWNESFVKIKYLHIFLQNASLMITLANMQKLDIDNLPQLPRTQLDLNQQRNQNNMDESQ